MYYSEKRNIVTALRSSRSQMFFNIDVLKISQILQEND